MTAKCRASNTDSQRNVHRCGPKGVRETGRGSLLHHEVLMNLMKQHSPAVASFASASFRSASFSFRIFRISSKACVQPWFTRVGCSVSQYVSVPSEFVLPLESAPHHHHRHQQRIKRRRRRRHSYLGVPRRLEQLVEPLLQLRALLQWPVRILLVAEHDVLHHVMTCDWI